MREPRQGVVYLPGQMDLPQCGPNQAEQLQRRANAPLLSGKPQKPMDIGLFSDDADQLDLIEMFQDPTND